VIAIGTEIEFEFAPVRVSLSDPPPGRERPSMWLRDAMTEAVDAYRKAKP